MKNRIFKSKLFIRILWTIFIIILWQIIYKLDVFSPLIFPSFKKILANIIDNILNGELIKIIVFSLNLIIRSIVISLFLSVILAMLSIKSKIIDSFIDTLITLLHPLPGIALLPLIILWLGTGTNAIIFIIVHSVTWPLLLNLKTGFISTPLIYKKISENLQMALWQKVLFILIPSSFPYFLAGLKIGWARSWRALISAEMIFGAAGGIGGIGWYIYKNRVFMNTSGIFAGIIVIVIIGILIEDIFFNLIEKITVNKWGMTT